MRATDHHRLERQIRRISLPLALSVSVGFLVYDLLTPGGFGWPSRLLLAGSTLLLIFGLTRREDNARVVFALSAVGFGTAPFLAGHELIHGATAMSWSFLVLAWTGLLMRSWTVLFPGVALLCAPLLTGYDYVVAGIDVRGPAQIDLIVSVLYVAVASLIGLLVERVMDSMRETLTARLAELELQQNSLFEVIDDKASQLEAAGEQLMQAQKLKTVGTMASGLAHELNNILTPIRGLAELLADGVSPEQGQRYGRRILDSAMAAAQITTGLLTYTRQGTFQPVRSNARQLLQGQILPVLARTLPRSITLRRELADNVSIDVDRVLFQQCITNLVFNAADAMPDGGTLTISLRLDDVPDPVAGSAPKAIVEVTDTGVGIADEDLERIFEPFFTTKGVGAGTGLGLAMVQGIVERHGGTVSVQSEVSVGSTFRITLPLADREESVSGAEWPVLKGKQTGPVVVVLTDDQDTLDEVEELLQATDCSPICTSDLRAGRGLLAEVGDQVDLLVLDMDMEGLSGASSLRTVRELVPDLPLLLLSVEAMTPDVSRAMGSGMIRSMRKPIDHALFGSLLTDILHPERVFAGDFTPIPLSRSHDSGRWTRAER